MLCNGCGGEIDDLGGGFGYGDANTVETRGHDAVVATHIKTLCPKCTRVMKDILLNSDLSEHWGDDDGT